MRHAWIVVGAAAIATVITSTLRLAFGIFIDPMRDLFGWTPGVSSTAYAVHFVISGIAAIGFGRLTDRIGTRPLLISGALLFTAALLLTAQVSSLWQLYLTYGVLLGLASAAFLTPLHTVISRWFERDVGVALGIVVAMQGVGPMVLAPAFRYLIGVLDWAQAFTLTGLVAGAVVFLASLLIVDAPATQTAPSSVSGATSPVAPVDASVSVEELYGRVRRTRPFWLLPAAHLLGCISHAVPLVYVVPIAIASGVPGVTAAAILGLASGFSTASRFGMAVVAERLGGRRALTLTLVIQAAGTLLLLGADSPWMLYVFAFVFGIGYGGEMVVFPILNREYYSPRVIGSVYGFQMFGAGVGMALGGLLGGFLYDLTGSYTASIWLAALVGVAAVRSVLVLRSPAEEMQGVELPSPISAEEALPVGPG